MRRPTRLGHVEVLSTFPEKPVERAPVTETTPVIIRGSGTLGKVAGWTPEHLSGKLAGRDLAISVADADGGFRYDPDTPSGLRYTDIPGADLAREFRADTRKLCLQQAPIESDLPELLDELTVPPYVPADKINDINLWMASSASRTPLHFDDMHNVFAQVEGRKRFLLFNPAQFDVLYPGPINTRTESFSRVDLSRPDFRRFPRLAGVEYWEAVVWPGDMLFMPAYWWHQVSSQDLSVSVNYWWRPDVRDVLCPAFHRQLHMNINLEDVHSLFEGFDLDGLGAGGGTPALLALADLVLADGEPGAALRVCGGVAVAALRDRCRALGLPSDGPAAGLLDVLAEKEDVAGEDALRVCLTRALAVRPGQSVPAAEAAGLIERLRAAL
ncbi:cupin-like domain-containing protein [Actinomadura oligospora]|uniref:cupin-like domain-containing protein n=1 Tax=Actinomadura oligospora TaxID=111804 RepID=UPI0004B7BB01|nr:cupin-like domain-containing protein [Actinomadura oligospora]